MGIAWSFTLAIGVWSLSISQLILRGLHSHGKCHFAIATREPSLAPPIKIHVLRVSQKVSSILKCAQKPEEFPTVFFETGGRCSEDPISDGRLSSHLDGLVCMVLPYEIVCFHKISIR
jgi:hypothetical protein